jgi:hypothetical protein
MQAQTRITLSVLALAIGQGATAQITTTSAVGKFYGQGNLGSFTELSPLNPTSSNAGGNLVLRQSGDVRMELDPDELVTDFRWVRIGGTQQFSTSGVLPVEIDPLMTMDIKLVVAGGPDGLSHPSTSAVASLDVYLTGTYVNGSSDFGGLGEKVFEMGFGTQPQFFGNGYREYSVQGSTTTPYVLLPGESYTAVWDFDFYGDTGGMPAGSPAAAAFLEAGGITSYEGLMIDLRARTVPTPGALSLVGLAGLACARRRRG